MRKRNPNRKRHTGHGETLHRRFVFLSLHDARVVRGTRVSVVMLGRLGGVEMRVLLFHGRRFGVMLMLLGSKTLRTT